MTTINFDKSTQHLAKVRDSFDNTYIFSLPRTEIADYKTVMNKGDLLAYKLKNSKEFRKPHSEEKIEGVNFQFLPALTPSDSMATFVRRIEKLMNPETAEILKGGIKGAEKLQTLKVDEKAPETGDVLYKGKTLTKEGNYYYLYTQRPCKKCGEEVHLKAQVTVRNGVANLPSTKHPVNKDAHRVAGSRSEWIHSDCEAVVPVPETQTPEPVPETQTPEPVQEASTTFSDIDHALEILCDSSTGDMYKVAYLTGYFKRSKELSGK